MYLSTRKLDIAEARLCMDDNDLSDRSGISADLIALIREGKECMPKVCGLLAQALNCDPADLIADNTTSDMFDLHF